MGASALWHRRRVARAVLLAAVAGVAAAVACSSPTSSGADSVTQTVTDQGGVIGLGDITLDIPPGALSASQSITITRTTEPAPPGYEASSALYRFDPEGLVFAKPAFLGVATPGTTTGVTIIWTQGPDVFEPLATTFADGRARADILHFSRGFLGTPRCEHETSCGAGGAKCTFFESRCDADHDKEKRDDCECVGGAWRHTVRETACDGGTGAPCVLDKSSKIDMCILQ